jgi:hypothetical protein
MGGVDSSRANNASPPGGNLSAVLSPNIYVTPRAWSTNSAFRKHGRLILTVMPFATPSADPYNSRAIPAAPIVPVW